VFTWRATRRHDAPRGSRRTHSSIKCFRTTYIQLVKSCSTFDKRNLMIHVFCDLNCV
jgi:hypothetical protein